MRGIPTVKDRRTRKHLRPDRDRLLRLSPRPLWQYPTLRGWPKRRRQLVSLPGPHEKATVIDVTQVVTAVYQTHDYSHHPEGKEGIFQGTEYQRNIALVGDHRHSFTLDDRTEILTNKGLKPSWDARRLWRFIRTAPALYPKSPLPVRVAFGSLNGGINMCRQLGLRARVIRSADL